MSQLALDGIHRLLIEGKGASARPLLETARRGLEPAARAEFARLCWRAGLPELGLSALAACGRRTGHHPVPESAGEQAEHAQCLTRAGAPAEALALLRSADPAAYPRVHLYAASARIAQWDYAAAIPLLEKYLATTRAGTYDRLVGQVNLAAALVHEGQGALAKLALRRIALEASARKARLLHANALEIEAQALLEERRFDEAMARIRQAAMLLSGSAAPELWYTRKWEAIACLRGAESDSLARAAHAAAREEARAQRSWESVRQLDRELALRFRDTDTFRRVYFGTPFTAFRRNVARDWGVIPDGELSWRVILGDASRAGRAVLDLADGAYGDARLKPAQQLHRLLFALASDRYRPLSPAALFTAIFPGERYLPGYGKRRIHQALFVLRRWLSDGGIPLAVVEEGGTYHLEGAPACALSLPAWSPFEGRGWRPELARHRLLAMGDTLFSSHEAARVMGSSPRNTLRILAEGLREGWLARTGSRRGTRYRLVAVQNGPGRDPE